jgi:hypothetical protein
MKSLTLFLLFLSFPVSNVSASFGFNLDGTLDKPVISKAYFESDFERIRLPLETWRQGVADNKTREDSIFVFKYLSVIYAANPVTKEKSRSFMFMLLTLAPTIEIIDMYASDEIELMFRSVKRELKDRKAYLSTHDELGREKPDSSRVSGVKQPAKSYSSNWIWWTVGGVGLAAVAAGGYFLFHETASQAKESFQP